MPPKMTPPNTDTDTQPPDLIPDITTDETPTTKFAGIPIIPAKAQTKDAFNVLFYAYPGVGKTSLSGMFAAYPDACPVLVVDAEGGASVLAHLDDVYIAQVKTWREVDNILTQLERSPLNNPPYKTVVFDNVTEIHTMLLNAIAGTGQVEIQHHGRATAELMRMTRRVRDLSRFRGVNTVLIGWQENKEDKSRGLNRQIVALTDKLSTRLPGIPNNVGYITVLNNPPLFTRRMSFATTPLNDAKLRRAPGDNSPSIPLDIYYSIEQNPIVDILRTIYEGVPFPSDRYERPKGRGKVASATTTDANTADTGNNTDDAGNSA